MATLKYVKQEFFNPNYMKLLLNHNGLSYETKQLLKKYHKKRQQGNKVDVVYDYAKEYNTTQIGRVYAVNGLSLQTFERDVRNALATDLYWDIDMVNAHFTILLKVCKSNGWSCGGLERYVNNREEILSEIMTHYGCSYQDAKNLMIRMLFLGHPEGWVGDSVCENSSNHLPFVIGFRQEMENIANNVNNKEKDITDIVSKKRKKTIAQKRSSVFSLFLQSEEHKILTEIDKSLSTQGRSMDTYIFDGGLVRRLKDETEFPQSILRKCENDVKANIGYDIKLIVKPLKTSFQLSHIEEQTLIDPNVIIDDVFAAKYFAELMKDYMVYTDDDLYVFDDELGLWTKDNVSIRKYIVKYENELKFRQFDYNTGKEKLYNYSGIEKNINNMLKSTPVFCINNDFFKKNADTSRGKLLFSNGIYDFDTDTFTEGFDPNIVFVDRIDRPFPTERKEHFIKLVKKILFEDTFMSNEMEASDFLRIGIVRALYGDYRAKKFYFCVGTSNAGKGVLTDALKVAFGGFVGTFNAKALAYNDKNGSDAAKQLSWVFGIKDKRIAISNEVSMSSAFDGNMIKSLASGGDEFDARKNHIDEVKVINRSTMFCLVNDIPPINPYDKGVENRVNCIEYKCVFNEDGEINHDFERLADKEIKDKFNKDIDYQDALVHLMIDTYKEFKEYGHNKPDIIKDASKEWTGDAGSVEGLLKMKYEITRNENDYVSAREIIDYLTKEKKLKMSDTKIGRELGLLKLVNDYKKVNGKSLRVWFGVKELPCEYSMNDEYN